MKIKVKGKGTDRILIIESEPAPRRELVEALTEASFIVADVATFPEALLKLVDFKPDLAIVDEVLPGGDGIEVCSQLRNTFGIPVILIGSDSSGKAYVRATEAGADFYLVKPFRYRYPELVARVRAILRRYKNTTA